MAACCAVRSAWSWPGTHWLSGPVARGAVAGRGLMSAVAWVQTPLIVLARWRCSGLAPLTGWITFEERWTCW